MIPAEWVVQKKQPGRCFTHKIMLQSFLPSTLHIHDLENVNLVGLKNSTYCIREINLHTLEECKADRNDIKIPSVIPFNESLGERRIIDAYIRANDILK